MSIALFVEGKSDKDAIPELVRRFLGASPGIICRVIRRGDMFNSAKIKAHLEPLLKGHPEVSSFHRFLEIIKDP